MITVMDSVNKPLNESERCLDSQLWHACAGGMVQMPPVNSKVFYFPQGHAEHANGKVDFGNFQKIPSIILCRVSSIRYMADTETDEVYAKIGLVPSMNNGCHLDDEDDGFPGMDRIESKETPPSSFAKTLTQSDANNGGGFSVPRYCAETIFPRLDYSAEPPVQTILVKDVHGTVWKFRHIYRGTPRRHLLTTGWSNFVNHKKLVAGDSIVFLRADNGDLCVGIRRAKRGVGAGGGPELHSGWNTLSGNVASPYGEYSVFLRENEGRFVKDGNGGNENFLGDWKGKGRVKAESVTQAANLAAGGQPFEVVYYPRANSPEFCVKASSVRAAMKIQWCSGMRFKMAFETEDASRISWFMGTISNVQFDDPILWPNSPWRLLQVAWDEPDLLHNVKRVSPWLVELVSNMPIHLSPFSPTRKKLRLPQPPDFPLVGQFPMPPLLSNPLNKKPSSPLSCVSDSIPAGIQGARHSHFGLSPSDLRLNVLQPGHFPNNFQQIDRSAPPMIPTRSFMDNPQSVENISCLLSIGNPPEQKKSDVKKPVFWLFGKPIVTEQQITRSLSTSSDETLQKTVNVSDGSGSAVVQNGPLENFSDGWFPRYKDETKSKFGSETGHCKVFMESEDVGRTLDLSVFGSYEELYGKLAGMFGVGRSDMMRNVLYRDAAGGVKRTRDESFSEFLKSARRLTVVVDSSSSGNTGQ